MLTQADYEAIIEAKLAQHKAKNEHMNREAFAAMQRMKQEKADKAKQLMDNLSEASESYQPKTSIAEKLLT